MQTNKVSPIYLFTESPLHAGSGSDLGYIDLPIQRERHTGFPKVESSTLKGALRQAFEGKSDKTAYLTELQRVFGYDEDGLKPEIQKIFEDKKDFAGALGLTDARLLLFPVKSLKGGFAWITCPYVLEKFKSELEQLCGVEGFPEISKVPGAASDDLFLEKDQDNPQVQLEEYIYNLPISEEVKQIADWLANHIFSSLLPFWKNHIQNKLLVLSDDDFADFTQFSTEIHTRIKIDNATGVVKDGALFTEEYLPSESILYSLAIFNKEFRKDGLKQSEVENFFQTNKPQYFQMGGNASIGKGIIRLI